VGAHNNWGVPVKVLTSVNNAPWCAVRKSLFYPPVEMHGHPGSAWRVIKYVPLVTDFMGRVSYIVKAPLQTCFWALFPPLPFQNGFLLASMISFTSLSLIFIAFPFYSDFFPNI
jgi:hypothetical protein